MPNPIACLTPALDLLGNNLQCQADLAHSPKLQRASTLVADLMRSEALEYETL